MHPSPDSTSHSLDWTSHPTRALIRLAWPIAVSTVSWTVMTRVGTLFMAHVGADELAGVGFAGTQSLARKLFSIGAQRGAKNLV